MAVENRYSYQKPDGTKETFDFIDWRSDESNDNAFSKTRKVTRLLSNVLPQILPSITFDYALTTMIPSLNAGDIRPSDRNDPLQIPLPGGINPEVFQVLGGPLPDNNLQNIILLTKYTQLLLGLLPDGSYTPVTNSTDSYPIIYDASYLENQVPNGFGFSHVEVELDQNGTFNTSSIFKNSSDQIHEILTYSRNCNNGTNVTDLLTFENARRVYSINNSINASLTSSSQRCFEGRTEKFPSRNDNGVQSELEWNRVLVSNQVLFEEYETNILQVLYPFGNPPDIITHYALRSGSGRGSLAIKFAPFKFDDGTISSVLPKFVYKPNFNTSFFESDGLAFPGLGGRINFSFAPNTNPLYLMAAVDNQLMYYVFYTDPQSGNVMSEAYAIGGFDDESRIIDKFGLQGDRFIITDTDSGSEIIPFTEISVFPTTGKSRLNVNEFLSFRGNQFTYTGEETHLLSADGNFLTELNSEGLVLVRDKKGVNDNQGGGSATFYDIQYPTQTNDYVVGVFDGNSISLLSANGREVVDPRKRLALYRVTGRNSNNDITQLTLVHDINPSYSPEIEHWGFDQGANIVVRYKEEGTQVNGNFDVLCHNSTFREYFPKKGLAAISTTPHYSNTGDLISYHTSFLVGNLSVDTENYIYAPKGAKSYLLNGDYLLRIDPESNQPSIYKRQDYENNNYSFVGIRSSKVLGDYFDYTVEADGYFKTVGFGIHVTLEYFFLKKLALELFLLKFDGNNFKITTGSNFFHESIDKEGKELIELFLSIDGKVGVADCTNGCDYNNPIFTLPDHSRRRLNVPGAILNAGEKLVDDRTSHEDDDQFEILQSEDGDNEVFMHEGKLYMRYSTGEIKEIDL